MVNVRRGASKLGCLFRLLIVAAIGYFGYDAAQVYLRYYAFKDVMEQETIYRSEKKSIPEIRARFKFLADSMGMPEDAGVVIVRKTPKEIFIESHYDDEIILPGFRHEVHFEPKAKGNL